MNSDAQSWKGLPDHFKRQAAPDMLAGKTWMFWGKTVEHPGDDELRRWAGDAPEQAQTPSGTSPKVRTAERTTSAKFPPMPMTIRQKRLAVARALTEHPELSNRELARRLGVSHTFVAQSRKRCQH